MQQGNNEKKKERKQQKQAKQTVAELAVIFNPNQSQSCVSSRVLRRRTLLLCSFRQVMKYFPSFIFPVHRVLSRSFDFFVQIDL